MRPALTAKWPTKNFRGPAQWVRTCDTPPLYGNDAPAHEAGSILLGELRCATTTRSVGGYWKSSNHLSVFSLNLIKCARPMQLVEPHGRESSLIAARLDSQLQSSLGLRGGHVLAEHWRAEKICGWRNYAGVNNSSHGGAALKRAMELPRCEFAPA